MLCGLLLAGAAPYDVKRFASTNTMRESTVIGVFLRYIDNFAKQCG